MSQTLHTIEVPPPSPEDEFLARIERRVGRLHARQRLGVEQDHENNFDRGISLDNSRRLRALIRGILKVTGMYERGLRNTERIVVRENQVAFRNLPPAFDGFTLLHITDLHADMSVRAMRRLAEILPGLDYDVCVITGDFRGETLGPFDECMDKMARLSCPLFNKSVYTVSGNHDTIRMVPALEDMGIRVLVNESVAFERGGEHIHLAGIDDAHLYHLQNFEKATAEIPHDAFSIFLTHARNVSPGGARRFRFFPGRAHARRPTLPPRLDPDETGSKDAATVGQRRLEAPRHGRLYVGGSGLLHRASTIQLPAGIPPERQLQVR